MIAIFTSLGAASYQIYGTFATAYARELELNVGTILVFQSINAVLAIGLTLFFGWLSDYVGRKKLAIIGPIIVVPGLYYLFWALNQNQLVHVLLALFVLEIGHSMVYGPVGAFLAELFSTKARYTGISIAYQIGAGTISGLGPLIAATILAAAGGPPHVYAVPIIMVVLGALTTVGATK